MRMRCWISRANGRKRGEDMAFDEKQDDEEKIEAVKAEIKMLLAEKKMPVWMANEILEGVRKDLWLCTYNL